MEEFVRKLFSEYGFEDPITDENLLFFQKSDDTQVEYYLVDLVDASNLKNYLKTDNSESILNFFNGLKELSEDIEKNTTLLVFAELDELNKESHDTLKRYIWRIEEDEYFFNKSVILYDQNSTAQFSEENFLKDQLTEKVSNKEKFDTFINDYFEDQDYFFCIQLFIKIPFLEPPVKNEEFTDLQSIINNQLNKHQKFLVSNLDDSLINNFSQMRERFLDTTDEEVDKFLKKLVPGNETD